MDLGGHPIQRELILRIPALHRMCGASYCPATAYTAVHGYAPSCTWRVIAGTSHPEHEHVIFVYLEIWHPRSHPTSGSSTSQILDIQILDISDSGSLDLEIWRVGIWIWGSRPLGTLRIPRNTPFWGSILQHIGTLPWPKTPLYDAKWGPGWMLTRPRISRS